MRRNRLSKLLEWFGNGGSRRQSLLKTLSLSLSLSHSPTRNVSRKKKTQEKFQKLTQTKWHHLQWSKDLCVALGSCHPLWNDVTLHLPCNVISVNENSNSSIHPNKFVFLPNFKPNRKAHPKLDSMAIISSNDWTNE